MWVAKGSAVEMILLFSAFWLQSLNRFDCFKWHNLKWFDSALPKYTDNIDSNTIDTVVRRIQIMRAQLKRLIALVRCTSFIANRYPASQNILVELFRKDSLPENLHNFREKISLFSYLFYIYTNNLFQYMENTHAQVSCKLYNMSYMNLHGSTFAT